MQKISDRYRVILASGSPRRKELLSGIDIKYDVLTLPDIDEAYPSDMPPEKVPVFLARKKASAYDETLHENTLLITADTVVVLNDRIFGKPSDAKDAKRMLQQLSGQTHRVITGVCLTTQQKQRCFSDETVVTFGKLSEQEIAYYVKKYNPLDKAGAYGVQEWIGYIAVEKIDGSYFNVMGLPVFKVYRELQKF